LGYVLLISFPCASLEACIVDGLYRALGVSAGGRFSSEDITLIYRRVFHYPSTADDVFVALKTVNQCG
jgi:hypothetical protein